LKFPAAGSNFTPKQLSGLINGFSIELYANAATVNGEKGAMKFRRLRAVVNG
jgi:hypothetical protein